LIVKVGIILLLVIIFIIILIEVPPLIVSGRLHGAKLIETENNIRIGIVQLLGFFVLIVGTYYTIKRVKLSEENIKVL